MKVCSKCKIAKELSFFGKANSRKDGAQRICKECMRIYDAERHAKNRDARNAANAAWRAANKDKVTARMKEYCLANKERRSQYSKEYYWANRDRLLAENSKYRAENKEKESLRNKKWAKNNPEKCVAKSNRRRSAKYLAGGSHTHDDVMSIFESQRGLCANCHIKLRKTGNGRFHADHIVPLSKGGSDDKHNIQCLCPACNIRKNAKDPIVWASENNRLL